MKPKSASLRKRSALGTVLLALCVVPNMQTSFAAPTKDRPEGRPQAGPKTSPRTQTIVYYPDPTHLNLSAECLDQYKREPNNEIAFWKAGNYLLKSAQVSELRNLCKQTSNSHPHWATPYFVLAKLADSGLDDLEAAVNYRRAFELSPTWLAAANGCAQKLVLCGKPKEAIPIADAGLKICWAYENSLVCAEYIGQLTRCKAEALYNLKDYAAAAQTLETMGKLNRSEPMEKQLATCYKASKQWTKCLATTNSYIKDHPDNEDFRLLRAQAYVGTGQWQKAADDLTVNLKLHRPIKHRVLTGMEVLRKREVLLLRAQMYEKLGRKDLAKKDRNELNRQMVDSYQEAPFINPH